MVSQNYFFIMVLKMPCTDKLDRIKNLVNELKQIKQLLGEQNALQMPKTANVANVNANLSNLEQENKYLQLKLKESNIKIEETLKELELVKGLIKETISDL